MHEISYIEAPNILFSASLQSRYSFISFFLLFVYRGVSSTRDITRETDPQAGKLGSSPEPYRSRDLSRTLRVAGPIARRYNLR